MRQNYEFLILEDVPEDMTEDEMISAIMETNQIKSKEKEPIEPILVSMFTEDPPISPIKNGKTSDKKVRCYECYTDPISNCMMCSALNQ